MIDDKFGNSEDTWIESKPIGFLAGLFLLLNIVVFEVINFFFPISKRR